MAIKIFEGLEFLNQSLVLVFKHRHTVFKTFDIFLLLPATLPGSLPGTNTRQVTTGHLPAQSRAPPRLPPKLNRLAGLPSKVCVGPWDSGSQALRGSP